VRISTHTCPAAGPRSVRRPMACGDREPAPGREHEGTESIRASRTPRTRLLSDGMNVCSSTRRGPERAPPRRPAQRNRVAVPTCPSVGANRPGPAHGRIPNDAVRNRRLAQINILHRINLVYSHLAQGNALLSYARMGRLGCLLHPGVQPSHSAAPNTVGGFACAPSRVLMGPGLRRSQCAGGASSCSF
jgi:hypothetical protein